MSEGYLTPGCFDSSNPVQGVLARSYNIFGTAPITANGNSNWLDVRALKSFSVMLRGTWGGGSIQMFATNVDSPSASETGFSVGAAINANGLTTFSGPFRYVRFDLTGATNPSLAGVLHGTAN